jgi:hypothetical protein
LSEHDRFEQFDVMIPADDFTRSQIAGVTIHWSVLELMVERVIDSLKGGSGIVEYSDSVERRVDAMKKLAKLSTTLTADQLAHLLKIASAILAMREHRDRVVHGLWTMGSDGKLGSFHPWAKNNRPSKPLDGDMIREIKLRIFALHRELEKFIDSSLPARFFGRPILARRKRDSA